MARGLWRRLSVLLALVLSLAGARPARAVTFLETAGAPSSRHPFTARVWPSGPSSAYFNPCLLTEAPSTVLFGPFGYVRRLSIDYDPRPSSALVPDAVLTAATSAGVPVRELSRALPTGALPRARGAAGDSGVAFYVAQGNHTQIIPGRLALGFYLLLAGDAFSPQQPFFPDEREQFFSNSLHFELLGDRLENVAFSFGLSGKPLPWLSLGAGISLALSTDLETRVYVPDAARPLETETSSRSSLAIRLVPHFAVAAEPIPGLRLTSTVHLAYDQESAGAAAELTRAPGDDGAAASPLLRASSHTFGSLPLRVALGVSWDSDGGDGAAGRPPAANVEDALAWSVAATVLWTQWSDYRDRNGERPRPRWSDTVSLALGGDLRHGAHAVGLDLAWTPSPVPRQDGRTSYVDNDRLGVAAGYDLTFDLGAVRLVAGVQLQFQALLPRHVTKSPDAAHPIPDELPDAVDPTTGAPLAASAGLQTNSPGYPGYQSAGWLLGAGGSLRLQF
jgi:hypothetical protein